MISSAEVPRFRRESLNARLVTASEQDAFQQFAAEVLVRDYPGIRPYPGGGQRDGCIDLVWSRDTGRSFFECKHLQTDGLDRTLSEWHAVAEKLDRNLRDPAGPAPGQPQYSPWFSADPPIESYTLVSSALLNNEGQRQSLLAAMRKLFADLSSGYPHLRHLANIRVQVRDWRDLASALADAPHLLFRWFPEARPRGLVPLGEAVVGSRFSEYLGSDKLPYYPRRLHLELHPAPPNTGIHDEDGLLEAFERFEVNGLLITGGGGFGKTRLMFELGYLAQSRGWTVLRVRRELKPEVLERLADWLRPNVPTLLLIDYVETQPAFGEVIETLDLLVEERFIALRYIACCRSSFYPAIQLIGRHHRVDLSPKAADPAADTWLEGFRESTVRHIVARTGLPSPDRVLSMSRSTPVLAVFAAWLHAHNRATDLQDLLSEPDFGTWVHKRVQQSFPDPATTERLGMFMAFFPFQEATVDLLSDQQARLLDTLAQDGWVERVGTYETEMPRWEVAHDVLADQVLLSCLALRPATMRLFVRGLFEEAARLGCVLSALTSLQRIGGQQFLRDLPWAELITEAMERHPTAWRDARIAVLRFPLLSVDRRIGLLGVKKPVWNGSEEEIGFQNVLGWLARAVVEGEELNPDNREVLLSWIRKAAPRALGSNFLLTQGLRLDPPSVRKWALDWLFSHPGLLPTDYLLRGWFLAKQPPEEVRTVVARWLELFSHLLRASYVLQPWLDSGGGKELVRGAVDVWLRKHGTSLQAGFVLSAWLDAGGESDLVKEGVGLWLRTYGTTLEAGFVLKAWLDAPGELPLVTEAIGLWLLEHGTTLKAGFVLNAWLGAGGGETAQGVREHVDQWLEKYSRESEAGYVLVAWLSAKGSLSMVQNHVSGWLDLHVSHPRAFSLINAWLKRQGNLVAVLESAVLWIQAQWESEEASAVLRLLAGQSDLPAETVRRLLVACRHGSNAEASLSRLVFLERHLLRPELAADVLATCEALACEVIACGSPGRTSRTRMARLFSIMAADPKLRSTTSHLFLEWLRHPKSYGALFRPNSLPPLEGEQGQSLLYIDDLISGGALSLDHDRQALSRFLAWLRTWEPDKKESVRLLLIERAGLSEPLSVEPAANLP